MLRRALSTTADAGLSSKHNLILGCGSNVMDLFYKVRRFPKLGEKQYFAEQNPLSACLVGGT